MTLDRAVLLFAGAVVLFSTFMSQLVSPWWLALTAFAGVNMIQSSFSGWCPAVSMFRKLGIKSGVAFK